MAVPLGRLLRLQHRIGWATVVQVPADTTTLRKGRGVDDAYANCLSCHSADYVNFQPPKMGRGFWEAEVSKMINAYGAPINATDAEKIIDYLANSY